MQHYLNYIDDQWHDASRQLIVKNPATDEGVASIAKASIEEADLAMEAAKRCASQGLLSDIRPAQRVTWMLKAAEEIRNIADDAAVVLCLENGKNLATARDEFIESARYFEYYAGMADKIEGICVPLGKAYVNFTQYIPMGVSVQIIPWNFPVSICARSLAPALAAGNAVVLKSPEISPIAITLLIKAIAKAGFPKGAINLLCGKGSEIGNHLVTHPHTNQIVFTGSVATGQRILKAASAQATPCVMELGGKSAAIALADVNIATLLSSVKVGIFYNAGQVCSAMSRLLIHRSRYKEVKIAVVGLAQSLSIGVGTENPDLTPVVSHHQQQQILQMIDRARKEGATVLTGGEAIERAGYFVAPTIIEASPQMAIAQQEVFGPVLVIMPYDDEDEAVAIANGTEFGLVAGVFGEGLSQTMRIANQLIAGQVFINEWFAGGVETPFGGVGLSGFGREKGQEAIYSYVQTRNIAVRLSDS